MNRKGDKNGAWILMAVALVAIISTDAVNVYAASYGASPSAAITYNFDEVENNARNLDFWLVYGPETNRTYYKGNKLCENCSFYKEPEFLSGNRIYLDTESKKFIFYYLDYKNLGQVYFNSFQQTIGIQLKSNITSQEANEQLIEALVNLGVLKPTDTISFKFEKSIEAYIASNDNLSTFIIDDQKSSIVDQVFDFKLIILVIGITLILAVLLVKRKKRNL